jgi:hypothetical protein
MISGMPHIQVNFDQRNYMIDSKQYIVSIYHIKRRLFPHGYMDLSFTFEAQIHVYDLHLGLADTKTSGITFSLFHGYLNSHNFEMQLHTEANYITRNNIFDHILFIS